MRWLLPLLVCVSAHAADPALIPGKPVRWPTSDTEFGFVTVQLPRSVSKARPPQVLFYFHGTGGHPNVFGGRAPQLVRDRYVLVGMSYAKTPTDMPMIERGRKNWQLCRSLRDRIAAATRIDGTRCVVTGFSRGGWMSNAIADTRPRDLAGAAILGAGKSPMHDGLNGKLNRPLAILVGIGECDVNFGPSQEAVSYYNGLGATVHYEEFLGEGHTMRWTPRLLAWFHIQAATSEEKDKMAAAIKDELRTAFKLEQPVHRYLKASDLAGDPRFHLMTAPDQMRIKAARKRLRQSPALRAFNASRDVFRATVKAEVIAYGNYGGRAADLRKAYAGYRKVFTESAGSPYSRRALYSAKRLTNVWTHILSEYPHYGNPEYESARNAYHRLFAKAKREGGTLATAEFAELEALQSELARWGKTPRTGDPATLMPEPERAALRQRLEQTKELTGRPTLRSGLAL